MKATIKSTSAVVRSEGREARVWEGVTEGGVPFEAHISRVIVREDHSQEEFERDLRPTPPARVEVALPEFLRESVAEQFRLRLEGFCRGPSGGEPLWDWKDWMVSVVAVLLGGGRDGAR